MVWPWAVRLVCWSCQRGSTAPFSLSLTAVAFMCCREEKRSSLVALFRQPSWHEYNRSVSAHKWNIHGLKRKKKPSSPYSRFDQTQKSAIQRQGARDEGWVLVIHQTKSETYYENPTLNRDCIKSVVNDGGRGGGWKRHGVQMANGLAIPLWEERK
jgi:hypothetical protein